MSIGRCNSGCCTCTRRVLVVENHLEDRDDHVEDLTRWGYVPIVAEGWGEALLEDAKKKVRMERCHLALVDMRLRDDNDQTDYSGLELVQDLKPARAIIVTGYGSVPVSREAHDAYHAFEFFGKEENPEALHKLIQKALNDLCLASLSIYPANWLEEWVAPQLKSINNEPIAADEVRDVLTLLFSNAREIVLEQLTGSTQSPSAGSSAVRHRSFVFKAIVDNQEPIFVKLATTNWAKPDGDKIKLEKDRYKTYVERQLAGNYHARLEFGKRLWNIGGVAYSFIGNSGDASIFSQFYSAQSVPEKILTPLKHFFEEVWYKKYRNSDQLNGSLFDVYDKIWDYTLSNHLPDWQLLNKLFPFIGIHGEFPEPRAWMAKKKTLSKLPNLRQCVIHGDLHADNLFADHDGHAWVIDFERTGEGHIVGDFVELEQDILTRLATFSDDDLSIFYELAIAITMPTKPEEPLVLTKAIKSHPEAYKAFQVVRGLREIAVDQCHYHDHREYYWGVLLDTLFVNTKLDQGSEKNRWNKTLLLASIICRRLDNWDNSSWPPKDWPPVTWLPPERAINRHNPDVLVADSSDQSGSSTLLTNSVHAKSQDTKQGSLEGFALLIGVGNMTYHPKWSLPTTVDDAQAVYNLFVDRNLYAYPPDQVRLLSNSEASISGIQDGLKWLINQTLTQPRSTAIVYFSGHGWQSSNRQFALVPSSARHDDMFGSLLWADEFTTLLGKIEAERLLVVIDSCHSGGTVNFTQIEATLPPEFRSMPPTPDMFKNLSTQVGKVFISSCSSNQLSYILPGDRLSIFTRHFVDTLREPYEDLHNNQASTYVFDISSRLSKKVREIVSQSLNLKQEPWYRTDGEDFSLALV